MHLGHGAITPQCGVLALGVAAAGAGVAWQAIRKHPISRNDGVAAGGLGAALFAAHMFNVSVMPFVSAHLVGGVLLAWIIRPPLALLTMTTILTIQALLLGDGGPLALGANVVNMGVVPAALVAIARRRVGNSGSLRSLVVLGVTSILAIVAAAGLIVGEVALFRTQSQLEGLGVFAAQLLWTHLLIGLFECAVTVALVMLIARSPRPAVSVSGLSGRMAVIVGACGLVLAVLGLPALGWVSPSPDGYEATVATALAAGTAIGTLETTDELTGVSSSLESVQAAFVMTLAEYEAAVALLATLMAGGLAWMMTTAASRSDWPSAR